jgi:cytochrome c
MSSTSEICHVRRSWRSAATAPRRRAAQRLFAGALLAGIATVAVAQTPAAPAVTSTRPSNSAPPASAALCFSCHGPDGNPLARDYPILNGQQRDYLVAALGAYRASERTASANAQTMTAIAKGLTDAEIAELADWFAMVRR